MSKNILILCTGNSCRSIIAEALINKELDGIKAYSSGVKASGKVNPNAKKILEENNCWSDEYHSKVIEEILHIDYDLVITVCDNANESCPIFPKETKVIHVGFEDPDGKEFGEFVNTYQLIKKELLPIVSRHIQL
ncbi:MAG TPA: arsenate reductase ArsC [Arcobacter sp.]|nr:arsenate reductase ArsC [Arcobacter sp.]